MHSCRDLDLRLNLLHFKFLFKASHIHMLLCLGCNPNVCMDHITSSLRSAWATEQVQVIQPVIQSEILSQNPPTAHKRRCFFTYFGS